MANKGRTGSGRVALVTGASSGIGAATARLLAQNGTTVALVARRAERLAEVLADCAPSAPESRVFVADLSDPERAAELGLEIWDAYGAIDILMNNAGVPKRKTVTNLGLADVQRVMTINFFSPVAITLALLPRMIERGQGMIVNVGSLGGRIGVTTEAAYSASKFALSGWSEAMAADLARTGVEVRLILPGAIDTELWDQPDNDPPLYQGPLVPVEEVAAGIVAAIEGKRFETYLPDLKPVVESKTADFDAFMVGMRAMADHELDPEMVGEAVSGKARPR